MKKTNKLSTISIACVACAAVSLPALGAAPVRSLGGAGVYSSASSAASAKTTATANRGGTLRANTATAAAPSLRSSTARAAATPRLSIGKYLAGSSALNKVTSVTPGQPGQDSSDNTEVMERIDELSANVSDNKTVLNEVTFNVEELRSDLEKLMGESIDVVYDSETGDLTIGETTVSILNPGAADDLLDNIIGDKDDIDVFDSDDTEKTVVAAINKLNKKIDGSTNSYEAGDNVKIENNRVSVIVGALANADTEPNKIATVGDVKTYALPQPDKSCTAAGGNTTCVLSINRNSGEYEWLELVETYSAPSNGTTGNSGTVVSEPVAEPEI